MFPDGLDSSAFGQETGCALEVAYGWINAGEIVHVVDCLLRRGSVLNEYREVFQHCICLRELIHGVEVVLAVRDVYEESVSV